jgi:hypothetical protein
VEVIGMRVLQGFPAVCVFLLAMAAGEAQPSEPSDFAQYLVTVTDDFIVNLYHNGELVSDTRRKLLVERFGATVEQINVRVKAGDWLVFNVANNRLRWGGVCYFGVAGVAEDERTIGFTTELASGRWSCCDNPSNVARFISDRDFLADNTARSVARPWHEGDEWMKRHVSGWAGAPLWGSGSNTWIKFVATGKPPQASSGSSPAPDTGGAHDAGQPIVSPAKPKKRVEKNKPIAAGS